MDTTVPKFRQFMFIAYLPNSKYIYNNDIPGEVVVIYHLAVISLARKKPLKDATLH